MMAMLCVGITDLHLQMREAEVYSIAHLSCQERSRL